MQHIIFEQYLIDYDVLSTTIHIEIIFIEYFARNLNFIKHDLFLTQVIKNKFANSDILI